MDAIRKHRFLTFVTAIVVVALTTAGPLAAEEYRYDPAGRLIQVAYDDGTTIDYTYDPAGNLLRRLVTVTFTLADVIRVLQALSENPLSEPIYLKTDVDQDGRIELGEVLYLLQTISGLRD